MTTVPGTYFTKEQLEAARKVDNVSVGDRTGSDRMRYIGFIYGTDKKQYNKALGWYILAAMENNSTAYNNIGALYHNGYGVPQNYLCALKWLLKAAEQCEYEYTPYNIGILFEDGYGVPPNKYKALEWHCHGGIKADINTLNNQGYHLSATDKKKTRQQLIKETEAIVKVEKKKLEEKQNKTQEEREALVDLNITYKLADGGKDAWKYVPVLFTNDIRRYTQLVNSSVTNKDQEMLELKEQIQLLKQEKSILIGQTKELPPIKHEESNFQFEIKEKDRQIALLRNDFQLLQHKNVTFQQQINANDIKMASLQRENQELQLKTKKLQKENKRLKQNANSRETRPSSSTTVPESTTSSSTTVPEPTTSNTDINEDDPNNDFNYDTECGTEYSSSDDTSSEDGDRANDLNYDSDV